MLNGCKFTLDCCSGFGFNANVWNVHDAKGKHTDSMSVASARERVQLPRIFTYEQVQNAIDLIMLVQDHFDDCDLIDAAAAQAYIAGDA